MQRDLIYFENIIIWYMPLTFTFQERYNQIQVTKLFFSRIKDKFLNFDKAFTPVKFRISS